MALELTDVSFVRDGNPILRSVTWRVTTGERWVVLGPNGAGKTTLLRIASLYEHPSSGRVAVAGGVLGQTDMRLLRQRIGLCSPAFGDLLRPGLTALDVVMTARYAALEPWWHTYDDADRAHALAMLDHFGVAHVADRAIGTASSGERQRIMLARAFAGEPAIVLLDEPTAGLDLGAREDLVARLGALAADPAAPPSVLVTHHVEEIPLGTTHALLVRDGTVAAAGPVDEVVTADALSEAFALPLHIDRHGGRYSARALSPAAS